MCAIKHVTLHKHFEIKNTVYQISFVSVCKYVCVRGYMYFSNLLLNMHFPTLVSVCFFFFFLLLLLYPIVIFKMSGVWYLTTVCVRRCRHHRHCLMFELSYEWLGFEISMQMYFKLLLRFTGEDKVKTYWRIFFSVISLWLAWLELKE